MVTIILSSLAALLFLWSGQRFLSDRLQEKDRIKGRERRGFIESFFSSYQDLNTRASKQDEAAFYLIQGVLISIWLFLSAISWGLLEAVSALMVTLGLLFLALGIPRALKIRKKRQFTSLIASQLPLSSIVLLVAADKSKNLTPAFSALAESLKQARVEPILYRALKRVETRLRYGMRPHMALERFAKEIDTESADKFSMAVGSSFASFEGPALEDGMVNLRLFSSESEAVFHAREEVKSRVCFTISSFLLVAVVLASLGSTLL